MRESNMDLKLKACIENVKNNPENDDVLIKAIKTSAEMKAFDLSLKFLNQLKETSKDFFECNLKLKDVYARYWNYAKECLKNGDIEHAKDFIDFRFKGGDFTYPRMFKSMWNGVDDLSRKTLLVYADGDLSHIIRFAKFLPEIKKVVKKLIFVTPKETIKLFRASGFDFEIYPTSIDLNSINYDFHLPLMSALKYFNAESSYLKVKDEDVRKFRRLNLKKSNYNVGILTKNLASKDNIEMLSSIVDIQLFSFEKSNFGELPNLNIVKENDIYDLAVAIQTLSLIITVDDVCLDIAGSLGKKTFALIDSKNNVRAIEGNHLKDYECVKPFVVDNIDKTFVYLKKAVDDYRWTMREAYLLSIIEELKNKKYPSDKERQESINYTMPFVIEGLYECNNWNIKYIDEALKLYEKEYEMHPDDYTTLGNIETLRFAHLGDESHYPEVWEKIVKNTNSPDILFNYGCFSCKKKNFKDFYKYYPYRFKKVITPTKYPKLDKPEWSGDFDISDKTIAVVFEQGYGDIFCFCRFLLQLEKLAKKVIFVTNKGCRELLSESFPTIKIIDDIRELDALGFDCHIPMMNLPIALKIYPDELPDTKSWLVANEKKIKDFKKYFSKDKFNIGIFTNSQRNHFQRYLPIENISPIAKIEGVQLYSLAIDKKDIELNYFDDSINIINLGKHFKDFSDTAAAIENCDLVVATDSSVLNLAGALGKKTFAIFNKKLEWRWFDLTGEDVVWYKSVKPFVAKELNDFSYPVNCICEEIKKLLK